MSISKAVQTYYRRELWPERSANFRSEDIRDIATAEFGVTGCSVDQCNMLKLLIVGDEIRILDLRAHCVYCNPAMCVAVDITCNWSRGRTFSEVLATAEGRQVLTDLVAGADDGNGADDLREKIEYVLYGMRQVVRSQLGMALEAKPAIARPATGV